MTDTASATGVVQGSGARPGRRRLRLRTVLLLVVLVPTAGIVLLALILASRAADERSAARRVESDASALVEIIDARAAVADEETVSGVLSIGNDLGADAERMGELYGVDYLAQLDDARAVVDTQPVLTEDPDLAVQLEALSELRARIDDGSATFVETNATFSSLTAAIDASWERRFGQLRGEMRDAKLVGEVHDRLDALHGTFLALRAGADRVLLAMRYILDEPSPSDVAALLDAGSRFEIVTAAFDERLGENGIETWRDHLENPAAQRFEEALDRISVSALAGAPSALSTDPTAFGEVFVDGAPWSAGLNATVTAAGEDLRLAGNEQADDASYALQRSTVGAATLVLLTAIGASILARSITRPVRRLEQAAQQIQAGRFDHPAIAPHGPRELADTATAFNEMAGTLSAVEAHAVALADDPEAQLLSESLPGRTGRALQVALNRLRSSMQVAEQRRRELEQAATHDALTGLLNRAAAFEMLDHDLARVERSGGNVMALFVDLDGLKPINDAHGHAAGDDALRLTAEALRAATRSADIVARIGGDEFLVAGVTPDGPRAVEETAERVRRLVSEREVAGTGNVRVQLRCSVGMALAEPGLTAEELVNRADAALYEAKRRGRDQIAWYPDSQSADR